MKYAPAVLLFSMLLFYSCKSPLYVPQNFSMPNFDDSKQFEAKIGARNFQIAGSFSKHFAAFFHAQYLDRKGNSFFDSDNDDKWTTHNEISSGTFGLACFKKIDLCNLQFASGFGYGTQKYQQDYTFKGIYRGQTFQYNLRSNNIHAFIMPAVTFPADNLIISMSARIGGIQYKALNFSTNNYELYTRTTSDKNPDNYLLPDFRKDNKKIYYFFEPAVTLRKQSDNFFWQTYLGYSKCMTELKLDSKRTILEFSIGVVFP